MLLGAVLGAHGIKGEVKVKTFTLKPENLGLYGPLTTRSGRRLKVLSVRATQTDQAVVAFDGIGDRNAAEALISEELFVARAAFPAPEPGEFYEADLLSLKAEDRTGKPLGKVRALHNFGAGDVLEIELLGGNTEFVPFHGDAVHAVDLKAGRIVVELPPLEEE
ncbi:MAG TPA: ribosome maturation factor RimM [Micropepsaceae bacterium]|nr:ribosome maturation factor RimM [Micropepsaceae bacterium]